MAEAPAPVTIAIEGAIAVVTIDNPPVNAASRAVRAGLRDAIRSVSESGAKAAVLIGAGRTFVAGADAREFDAPPVPPLLGEVVDALEESPVPFIAAIHGHALGGGLELALGCAFRIATPDARLGFPEVNLGLIPGAGGTVRLPRLVPVADALTMIVSGKPVTAQSALDIGLIDAIENGDLRAGAIALARRSIAGPRQLPLVVRAPSGVPDDAGWLDAEKDAALKARGQVAPVEAVHAIRDAIAMAPAEALEAERARFVALKDGPQSAALRHVFFAERSVARLDRVEGVKPRPLDRIGVVGGGTMGAGIATAALLAGLPVVLIERDADAVDHGRRRIGALLDGSRKRGVIDADGRSRMDANLGASTDIEVLSKADLVIEAVFEDMAVKRDVFGRLDAATRPDAVLATNTSYLDVAEIARAVADPKRVIGLHFFSPAHVMKLLEVVHTAQLADDVLATGLAFGRKLRKICVPCGNREGFIGNRVMSAYRHAADDLLDEGALPHQIDAAMTEFGFAMGLYAMQDMAGLDIAWAARKRRNASLAPEQRSKVIADLLCEAGRLGQKTGRGWHDYSEDGRTPRPDAEVAAMIEARSAERGIARRAFTSDQIMDRLLQAMRDEGKAVVADGVAAGPDAVDVVMINGFGFPRWRGGPMFSEDD